MSISDRLDEIAARVNAATEGPWLWTDDVRQRLLGGGPHDPSEVIRCAALLHPATADAEFIAHARTDVPRLLAALRAVLDLHKAVDWGDDEVMCFTCWSPEADAPILYPCPTVRAVTAALGEGS